MTDNRLTPLQEDVLHAFFRHEGRFFLTGGAALVGFYLHHRTTDDLDLFTTTPELDAGEKTLRAVAVELGASLEDIVTATDFRRRLLKRGSESVIVDLVLDLAAQVFQEKPLIGHVRIDPPEEILANKLCTLLSRAEPRDLVDVCFLERAGYRVEDAVPRANQKDGGLTPAQLGWVLSQISIGDGAVLPAGLSPADARAFLVDLQNRLRRMAFPS